MTLELLTAHENGLLGSPPGDLKLRLAGHRRESRLLEVRTPKCTIGAAADCTVRLDDAGHYPLHCLILRGAAATVVRRYSPVARLNGRDFADAVLKPGDRLAVGDYEIEIMPSDAEAEAAGADDARPRFNQERALARQHEILARQAAELALARQEFEDQCERLESEKAALIADRQAERQLEAGKYADAIDLVKSLQAEIARREGDFAGLQRSLDEERLAWERREQELEARLVAYEQRAAEQAETSERLSQTQADFAALQRTLSEERAAWQARGQELEARLAEREAAARGLHNSSEEAARLLADLESAQQALDEVRKAAQRREQEYQGRLAAHEQHAAEQAETLERLSHAQADFAALQRTLSEERAAWQARTQELEARLAEREAAATDLHNSSEEAARLRADLESAQQALDEERRAAQLREQEYQGRLAAHEQHAAEQAETLERLSHAQADFAALERTLNDERADWQARIQELESRLAEREAAVAELHKSGEEIGRLRADLESAQQALDEERKAAQLREQEFQARLAEGETAAGARYSEELAHLSRQSLQEISDLRSELEATRQLLADERSRWQEERDLRQSDAATSAAEAEARSAALQLQLVQLTNELESARRGLDEDRRQWEDLRQRQQEELAGRSTESEATKLPLESEAPPLEEGGADSYSQKPADEVAFEAPATDAPVSTADLLSRFGLSLDHDEPEEAPAVSAQSQPAGPPPVDEPLAPARHHGRHDEEDIDAYMTQLMARLGKPAYSAPREESVQPTVVVETAPEEVPPVEVARPVVPKLRDPSEMARRAPAPERSTDLSAMREIANFNARSAIDKHYRRTVFQSWLNKAIVTVVAVACALIHGWFALQGSTTAFYFALLSLVVAIFWGWQYAHMAKTLADSRATPAADTGATTAATQPPDSAT